MLKSMYLQICNIIYYTLYYILHYAQLQRDPIPFPEPKAAFIS